MTKITNNYTAPQGINTVDRGTVFLAPGQTQNLNVSDLEMDHYKTMPKLGIEGLERPEHESPTLAQLNAGVGAAAVENSKLQDENDMLREANDKLTADLQTVVSGRDALRVELDNVTSERDEAVAKQGDLQGQLNAANGVKSGWTTRHKGGGSYSIFDADGTEVVKGLTKEQTDVFDADDDVAKSKYVADALAAAGQ